MQSEERQKRIEDYLGRTEFASLDELSELVDASVSTVRRDLDLLEARGALRRTHGGARLINPPSDEFAFTARDTHQRTEKESIGKACAGLILPNQSVILDAGTTVFHAARYLEEKSPQILTNSLPVANHFAASNRLEVMVSGGVLYPRLGVLVGPVAVEAFSKAHADVAIMGAGGIDPDGVSNSHVLLIDIQRAMIQAARKIILCLDHTKLGRRSLSRLCPLDQIDILVTDSAAPLEMVQEFRELGIEVVTAPTPNGATSPPELDAPATEPPTRAKPPASGSKASGLDMLD